MEPAPDERVYRALLIGNSSYDEDPHNLPPLNGPVNDLPLLHGALTHERYGLFRPENVRILPERTKKEIATAMEEFFRSATRDDLLFLYYSGHGRQDDFGNLYLAARDTRSDLLVSTGISDAEINGMMRSSNAQAFVIVLDCCHAGAFKGTGIPGNLRGIGRFLLTSSRRGQLSVDTKEEWGASAFTRHFVGGLLLGTLDANADGYVSLNELYDYTLTRLREETKQIPQRHFDKTVGDVAIARAPAMTPTVEIGPAGPAEAERPVLAVSETQIEIANVQPGEILRAEVIDVFNEGGGALDWTVETDDNWISLEQHEGYFTMTFRPGPGINRGRVRVRDRGRGGSKTVRALVQVNREPTPPRLEVSTTELDFGSLSQHAESPLRSVRLFNRGGGALAPRVTPRQAWISAHQREELVEVSVDTSSPRDLDGSVLVESDGGSAEIRIRGRVEPGPILRVEPAGLDFGRVRAGRRAEGRIDVHNVGHGPLEWGFATTGEFFRAERAGEAIRVWLSAAPGHHVGAVAIRSNGGSATVEVAAEVEAPGKGWWRSLPRSVRAVAVGTAGLALVLLALAQIPEPPPPPPRLFEGRVTVPARQIWTETGLALLPGDQVAISARGEIRHAPDSATGPGGTAGLDLPTNVIPGVPHGALIGQVAGRFFPVGRSATFAATVAGQLLLGINDTGLDNNSGEFIAGVVVGRPGLAGPRVNRSVTVPAQQVWTDTGIDLEPGDLVILQAAGEIRHSPETATGPDGTEGLEFPTNVLPGVDHGALIGRAGEEGKPFRVGTGWIVTAAERSRLYLGINDTGVDNNSGAFTVQVLALARR